MTGALGGAVAGLWRPGGAGAPGGYRLGAGSPPAPTTDPSSIIAARAAGTNGWQLTYQNGAAGRDAPDTGACWSFPLVDVFGRTLANMGVASLDLPRVLYSHRVRERAFTAGSTVIIGVGIGDNASPIDASAAFAVGVRYTSGGSNREVALYRCVAGTWTQTGTGNGDTSTFGAEWTYSVNTTTNIGGQRAYPLDASFIADAVPGTNVVSDATARNGLAMTHFYLWTGLGDAAGNGAVHTFDGSCALLPKEV